jgi:hypothetical protein
LFSVFGHTAEHLLPKLDLDKIKKWKCLFISYALEDEDYVNFSKNAL